MFTRQRTKRGHSLLPTLSSIRVVLPRPVRQSSGWAPCGRDGDQVSSRLRQINVREYDDKEKVDTEDCPFGTLISGVAPRRRDPFPSVCVLEKVNLRDPDHTGPGLRRTVCRPGATQFKREEGLGRVHDTGPLLDS